MFGAKHILVKTLDEAKDLHQLIENGGIPFESIAFEKSMCPSKAQGGDLGQFGPGMMVPSFEQAVANMEVGALSQPVQTQFGYHLIKRTA